MLRLLLSAVLIGIPGFSGIADGAENLIRVQKSHHVDRMTNRIVKSPHDFLGGLEAHGMRSLRGGQEFCEGIIRVSWADDHSRNWEGMLAKGEREFAAPGRIREVRVSSDNAHAKIKQAVEETVEGGFKPVVLVPGTELWAQATSGLGRHQAFGAVYDRGPMHGDTHLMKDLLTGAQGAYAAVYDDPDRFLVVPSLDYARAQEAWFAEHEKPTRLRDFDGLGRPDAKGAGLEPGRDTQGRSRPITLISRLNGLRTLTVGLAESGAIQLSQKFAAANEPYQWSVRLGNKDGVSIAFDRNGEYLVPANLERQVLEELRLEREQ